MKAIRKSLSILLCVLITAGMLTALPFSAGAAEITESAPGAEVTFNYNVDSGDDLNTLKAYLEMDCNIKINIISDMDARIGKKGDRNSDYVGYWCTLGKGTKVINLNGHSLTLYNDREEATRKMTMFRIPEGAELVINDSKNSGEITYNGMLANGPDYKGVTYQNNHNIIEISGGKLTLNSGNLIAGKSNKKYLSQDAKYVYRQINGTAVTMTDGEAVINGGKLCGRGYRKFSSSERERASAVKATGGTLTINDGEFWGMGCADVLQIGAQTDIQINAGYFNTHKQDYDLSYAITAVGAIATSSYIISSSYGKIGIPSRESNRSFYKINYLMDGREMTSKERADSTAYNTSKRIEVLPHNSDSAPLGYETADTSKTTTYETGSMTFSWDKTTMLRLGVMTSAYFPELRSYDIIKSHTFPENTVTISTSPNGKGVSKSLTDIKAESSNKIDPDGWFSYDDMLNLAKLPKSALSELKVGQTYYVQITAHERWQSQNTYDRVLKPRLTIKITITPPDTTVPDYSVGFNWANEINSSGLYTMHISGSGQGSDSYLNEQIEKGKITGFDTSLRYLDSSGVKTTYQPSHNKGVNAIFTNFRHGGSEVEYTVTATKGALSKTSKKTSTVVYFPDLKSSVIPDSSKRVIFDVNASYKTVTFSCNANNYQNIFWARDGRKISGSDNQKYYTVNVKGYSDLGSYSLGYTVNGKEYYSDQSIYVGLKDGTRTVSLSSSASSCTISKDGDSTPTLTANVSGTGWGKISQYKWKMVSWPSGYQPTAKLHSDSTTTNSVSRSLAWILSRTGNETELYQGTYQIACIAYDVYGNQTTSPAVNITVSRPATGIKLYTHEIPSSYSDSFDITDKFVVLKDEKGNDAYEINSEFTPKNSVGGTVSYTSSDTGIAKVSSSGFIKGYKAGRATVKATWNGRSASTTVLVPKTKYDITIPDEWLHVEARGKVHRGALSVPSSADFTAELIWNSGDREYTADTFAGNLVYYPTLRIYPKKGVCYPVSAEDNYNSIYYTVDSDRFEISVNGNTYYGGVYCGRDTFYDSEPVSQGDKYSDFIDLDLDSTGVIIDPRDEYIGNVVFLLDTPLAGQPKDVTSDEISQLNCTIVTKGVTFSGDSVRHVTDLSSVSDNDIKNDKTEDFTKYSGGETYRYTVWLNIDSKYKTSAGGRAYFADTVKAVDPELKTITDDSNTKYNLVLAYAYFTVPMSDMLIGDVNNDGKVNGADAGILNRYTSGWSGYAEKIINMDAADINRDGKVNGADAGILNRYTSGWDSVKHYFTA